jgi:hypothetical protein
MYLFVDSVDIPQPFLIVTHSHAFIILRLDDRTLLENWVGNKGQGEGTEIVGSWLLCREESMQTITLTSFVRFPGMYQSSACQGTLCTHSPVN